MKFTVYGYDGNQDSTDALKLLYSLGFPVDSVKLNDAKARSSFLDEQGITDDEERFFPKIYIHDEEDNEVPIGGLSELRGLLAEENVN